MQVTRVARASRGPRRPSVHPLAAPACQVGQAPHTPNHCGSQPGRQPGEGLGHATLLKRRKEHRPSGRGGAEGEFVDLAEEVPALLREAIAKKHRHSVVHAEDPHQIV